VGRRLRPAPCPCPAAETEQLALDHLTITTAATARAARWALKRCIRAAFELAQPACGKYTRDLFWAAQAAGGALPKLRPGLEEALRLYVQLAAAQESGGGDGGGGEAGGARLEEQLATAWRAADGLVRGVDTALLRAMLTPEPGWLTPHQPLPGGGGARLPPLAVPVVAQVPAVDWRDPPARRRAAAMMAACLEGGGAATAPAPGASAWPLDGWARAADGSSSMPQPPPWYEDERLPAAGGPSQAPPPARLPLEHPVVLRGAGAAWPAAGSWTLDFLGALPGFEGRARVAPSLQFPFVEPQLAALLVAAKGERGPRARNRP
jgi:hypothetical protein